MVTGDLLGLRPHLPVPWMPSAELDALRMIEEKARLLDEASAHRWVLVLGHETEQLAGYVDAEGEWTAETALSP